MPSSLKTRKHCQSTGCQVPHPDPPQPIPIQLPHLEWDKGFAFSVSYQKMFTLTGTTL